MDRRSPSTLPGGPAKRGPLQRAMSPLRDFLHMEAAGGVLLIVGALVALFMVNTGFVDEYVDLWTTTAGIQWGDFTLVMDLRHWVNDGAMTIFFLVVGLEIKREVSVGHLAGRRAATLPVAAALGGMIVPALIYLAIAGRSAAGGWGIPMATDIALAVGVMTLASGVPASLRAFLLGLAVVDDIGAILVIAVFYSEGVKFDWLLVGAAAPAATLAARALRVHSMAVYVVLGATLWLGLYEAGIHPTLAGVVMGLLTPVTPRYTREYVDVEEVTEEVKDLSDIDHARATVDLARGSVSTVEWLEHVLHPWTGFVIVPVFAFANAGIEISSSALDAAMESPITWAVFAGLVVGKPLGVLLMTRAATRLRMSDEPEGSNTLFLVGAGNAAGIGFTVAIFIAELAFEGDPEAIEHAKLAILAASLLSGLLAYAVLNLGGRRSSHTRSREPAAAQG